MYENWDCHNFKIINHCLKENKQCSAEELQNLLTTEDIFLLFFPKQTEVFFKEKTLNKDKQEVSKKHKKN